MAAGESVKGLIEPRQRKAVEPRRFVHAAVVDAHPPGAIFLLDHHDRRRPRRRGGTRDVSVHELLDLGLDGDALLTVGDATRRLSKRPRVAGVDLMVYDIGGADVGVAFSEDIEVLVNEGTEF